jgi:spore maturation protein CgeB
MYSHGAYLPDSLREYDWVFTTKSFGLLDLGVLGVNNCSYLPHAFDVDVHRPRVPSARDLREFGCDVSFIGSWSPGKAQALEALVRLRPSLDLKVFGHRWQNLPPRSPLRPFVQFRAPHGVEYAAAISCSKINLGLLSEVVQGASSGDLITDRTFQIPATGGFLLHKRTPDLLSIFTEDVDCACFDGPEELATKIDTALANPERRLAIANRGKELVERAHSWDHRARTILDHYISRRAR